MIVLLLVETSGCWIRRVGPSPGYRFVVLSQRGLIAV
jgi:hypothetical protein